MSGDENYFAPWDIKKIVSKYASQFMGYGQQDSSEFLSLLLDLLHEDLNRIIKKPQIEIEDYDGTNEEKIAEMSWDMQQKRNKSVISENFAGQFKSKLECNKCGYVSIT